MVNCPKLQVLLWLSACAWGAQGIKVTFGTNTGPIVPAVSTASPPPAEPYKVPAPVWEYTPDDTPDPNANWRPQLFVPQPRYTNAVYSTANTQQPTSNLQRFVNSYAPQPPQNPGPVPAEPVQNYLAPRNIVSELSSQNLPGYGLRYFIPAFVNQPQQNKEIHKKEDDDKLNQIDRNVVQNEHEDSSSDLQWKYEKESVQRTARQQGAASTYVYQWPAYVPPRGRHH